MKLKDCLDKLEDYKKEDLGPHKKLLGIKYKDVLISLDDLNSLDWGVCVENSNPNFVSLVGTIINHLKGIDKPNLVVVDCDSNNKRKKIKLKSGMKATEVIETESENE